MLSYWDLDSSKYSDVLALVLATCLGLAPSMVNAQNNNWIEKKTLISCLEQAKRQGVSWKYLAYVENGGAHLLARRERGGDVFICSANQIHASPVYH